MLLNITVLLLPTPVFSATWSTMSGGVHVHALPTISHLQPSHHLMSVSCSQSIAGATVTCESYGNAYGCASASASSNAWAKAYAGGLAQAWADAWAGADGCCQNTAVVSAEGLAALQIELLAYASADATATACVAGARI
jgi:hypothetical protein